MKNKVKLIVGLKKVWFINKGKGKIKVISMSKIKKITAIKKNRSENGRRAEDEGSNPHSKEDGASRIFVFLIEIAEFNKMSRIEISPVMIENPIIISSFRGPFDWKSNILL